MLMYKQITSKVNMHKNFIISNFIQKALKVLNFKVKSLKRPRIEVLPKKIEYNLFYKDMYEKKKS